MPGPSCTLVTWLQLATLTSALTTFPHNVPVRHLFSLLYWTPGKYQMEEFDIRLVCLHGNKHSTTGNGQDVYEEIVLKELLIRTLLGRLDIEVLLLTHTYNACKCLVLTKDKQCCLNALSTLSEFLYVYFVLNKSCLPACCHRTWRLSKDVLWCKIQFLEVFLQLIYQWISFIDLKSDRGDQPGPFLSYPESRNSLLLCYQHY